MAIWQIAFGQKGNCDCPENNLSTSGKTDKIFIFSNGNSIGLCGFVDTDDKDTSYSEFILFQCGQLKILNRWDATQTCKIIQRGDTLIVQELYGLAIDKSMKVKQVPFYTTKFYVESKVLHSISFFRKDLPKYSPSQINHVIHQYKLLTKQADGDSILLVAHRLFWAYVSGSKEAGNHLDTFEKRFGPFDGAIAEEFHELLETYKFYKQ